MAPANNPRDMAAQMLSRRPLSEKELEKKLVEKGVAPAVAAETVSWLRGIGALDDGKYAEGVARRCAQRGFGAARIRQELLLRGVPRDVASEALAELEPPEAAIDRFIEKKLRGAEPDRDEIRRLSAALARRGYGWEEIRAALDRYLNRE